MTSQPVDACSHCGLPVSGAWLAGADSNPSDNHPNYCCFGCRFAASVALESSGEGGAQWTLTRLGLAIFFSMTVMVFTLAMWTQDVYDDASLQAERSTLLLELFRYLCLLFTTPVLLLLGVPMLFNAIEDLTHRRITTDALIVAGVVAAFIYSVYSVFVSGQHVYFEVACMVLVAVTLGRWLEATGKQKASDSLRRLEQLLPDSALLISKTNRETQTIFLDELKPGDHIRVLAGQRFPVDGVIHLGSGVIDEQIITGESNPKFADVSGKVFAGTLNIEGDFIVEVTEPAGGGALQRIVDAVQKSAIKKGRAQRLADRISAWFVPAVALIATGTFIVHTITSGLEAGMLALLSVLLIACPCALGIATPMAIFAAFGRAIRHGVLFRSGESIESLARVNGVCFDKTGTLTTGVSNVERFVSSELKAFEETLRLARTLAQRSTHHLSASIVAYTSQFESADALSLDFQVETRPGRGLKGVVVEGDFDYYMGSPAWLESLGIETPTQMSREINLAKQQGHSVVAIAIRNAVAGVFVFQEQVRSDAKRTIDWLREQSINVTLLTGDCETQLVRALRSWNVDVAANLLPEQKLTAIVALQKSTGPIAMVGDGINDAPALTQADIGIAMGCGADVSRDAADVCLLGDELSKIPWAIEFSKRTMATIRQNLAWAFLYNGIGIVLAALGLLNPIWAAVFMVGSSLFVVSNSLRLASDAPTQPNEAEAEAKPRIDHEPSNSRSNILVGATPHD